RGISRDGVMAKTVRRSDDEYLMPLTPQDIYETQQPREVRLLLRASTALHRRVERVDRMRWIVGIVLAASATLGIFYPDAIGLISAVGYAFGLLSTVLWTGIRSGLM
ncbi:S-4TM family putative pore-forming effector, partial [Clavibacter michiganensis]|uniref:S-4TM family putative pore-forming effector n=1 Tax=Clavibacter michiganensis TaxID=28447 RepID=UPI00292D549C